MQVSFVYMQVSFVRQHTLRDVNSLSSCVLVFCICTGLFCIYAGLFCIYAGLFCEATHFERCEFFVINTHFYHYKGVQRSNTYRSLLYTHLLHMYKSLLYICRSFLSSNTSFTQPIADRVAQNLEIISKYFQFSTRRTRSIMGGIISYLVLIVNPMGRILVR